MVITESTLKRAKNDFASIAKEAVKVDHIQGTLYVFGSELATLRLFRKYNTTKRNEKTRQAYSPNFKSWYFSLDV